MELLLDGSKLPEKVFFAKFREIVGATWEDWSSRDSTEKDSGSEWYCDQDDKFVCSGSAYDQPKLYRKNAPQENKECAGEQQTTGQS